MLYAGAYHGLLDERKLEQQPAYEAQVLVTAGNASHKGATLDGGPVGNVRAFGFVKVTEEGVLGQLLRRCVYDERDGSTVTSFEFVQTTPDNQADGAGGVGQRSCHCC